MSRFYEVRDPIHGFIQFDEWERDIINSDVYQRLRRIRQLSWTDMVYPGASHNRFEHCLGVMHVATQMFESIKRKNEDFLKVELKYDVSGFGRDLKIVRLAALLHDVGHTPFSHAGETLMPFNSKEQRRYAHEDYSDAAVRFLLKDLINNHRENQNYNITSDEIADFISGSPNLNRRLLWRQLITGQVDADRADYLLRDSYHIGVQYGRYDLARLINCLTIGKDKESEEPVIAIEEGGVHVAESLVLARYLMFTQVYFQHTRRAYDYHYREALGSIIKCNRDSDQLGLDEPPLFPPPTEEHIRKYLDWTDWKVLGALSAGQGGEHGDRLLKRSHYRRIYETKESSTLDDLQKVDEVMTALGDIPKHQDSAKTSFYKLKNSDIRILPTSAKTPVKCELLSARVNTLKMLDESNGGICRVYIPLERVEEAKKLLKEKGLINE